MTTTTEIADKIATEQNLSKAQAKAIVESVFKQIAEARPYWLGNQYSRLRQVQGEGHAGA